MSLHPWLKFYPRDWRGDQALRAVSIAARGLWMECLCIMHEAKPYGHLVLNGEPVDGDTLARMTGTSVDEVSALMAELRQAGVLSTTSKGVVFSRRMTKDHARARKGQLAVQKRYSQASDSVELSEAPNRSPNSIPTTQKPEARHQNGVSLKRETSPPGEISKALENWNVAADAYGLSAVKSLTPDRQRHLKARLHEHGLKGWNAALQNLGEMPFCLGKNDRGWKVTFDWLIKPVNLNKVLERAYARDDGGMH